MKSRKYKFIIRSMRPWEKFEEFGLWFIVNLEGSFCLNSMDGADCYQAEHPGRNDHETMILASKGVEFLVSAEGKEVPLTHGDGKTICLYFSANWCRPCKAFTPQLVQLYNNLLKKTGEKLEIIFVSFDRDEESFKEHFKGMPWLAVPFNLNLHRRLSHHFNVHHIPSLIPLCSDGKSEENAVDLIEEYGADAFPFTRKRREELKAIDEAKRQGGKLEELLACEGRNYAISKDGRKIPVSELIGKTIGLYFGAYWCPPSRIFTLRLIEAYTELVIAQKQPFEVIFISTDRDRDEFDCSLSTMPWLAIPYEDKIRQDLRRIFEIKGIPSLVLIGVDGKIISTNGRALVSSYGAMAFPFTESRIAGIEAALREEGGSLPRVVRDPKHEHELKLDMARAYRCDACEKQGKFWAFSCDVCDYDLHPACVEEIF
ncbi:hypothetical protein Nepgr_012581 [Nepenthes gracilis]|uniref:protein-disulfide reductase n=1 Tax=Nepenthes gracilis TaxID=150966 RepID=A0AAD3XNH0_NEPGR|nr:hypothetical protein Nepgr_012581 [Nepenthes gracilis]